ncbi:hypothetical protein ACWT_4091 [Actinoplanes sp. SE50]|uniref:hypothetical protein n=1 Tax=unclassified Actinoplanes TaxID=2626549 RepID=UPI00023EBD75|nr:MULTISPECIES: hypothetical protein [unclassified Actinoplanes]AEV85115.1 hypothetical protein ACPL_4220 [Actinoplanes sp. SE50/110]ATO83506.1 hypothetical protein ACWT_4091 [Actinoplanes sp. SE50]SLM00913.1 hypothetical protein ACSP50_4146 [Actinoplanes sp. SE50/110]
MSITSGDTAPGSYGLQRPTMADAREAMLRVHGHTGRSTWERLLQAAGMSGEESGDDALHRLLTAMAGLDPVSRLCAQALNIRLSSHTHLSAAHTMTRSTA